MIQRFRADDADHCFRRNFISVDPGEDGACIIVVNKKPVEIIKTALDVTMIAEAMQRHGVYTMIIERQFVKMNPASALELAWRTGMMVGAVANELGTLDLVEVYPTTWQSAQKKVFKLKTKLNRKQGIELAIMAAEVCLSPLWTTQVGNANKSVVEGISSAWGIASWWLGLQHDSE